MHSGGGEREKMSALIIYILRRSSRFYLPAVRIHGRVTRHSDSGRRPSLPPSGRRSVRSRRRFGVAGVIPLECPKLSFGRFAIRWTASLFARYRRKRPANLHLARHDTLLT